jgi:bifunctional DNase/RNase
LSDVTGSSSEDPMEAALAVARGDVRKEPEDPEEPGMPSETLMSPTDDTTEPAHDPAEPADDTTDPADDTTDPADDTAVNGARPKVAPMGDYRMAVVSSVTVDLPNQHPSVVLRETESPRRQLTFSVGFQDGIALSYALRRIPTPRPLTHELVTDILAGFDVDVVAVRLVGRQGATYFAELDLRGRTERSVPACRPSDALTIALRQPVPVPILIDARLFESVGDVAPPGA